MPKPTEHYLDRDAEERNRELREQWLESMHRAAPDVDWRVIEKENANRNRQQRNALVGTGGTLSRDWKEIGSRNQAGRMHAAALTSDGERLYAGSSRGGVWRATFDGNNWQPISDGIYGGSHGLVVIDGDPDSILTITDGGAVHVSHNEGLTWEIPEGLPSVINGGTRVLRDLSHPDGIFLLLRTSAGAEILRSVDRGASFTTIRNIVPPGNQRCDMWTDRVNPGSLFTVEGGQAYRSDDQGATWITLGTLPDSPIYQHVLSGSEAGAPTLYTAGRHQSQWKLYRSLDAGMTWEYRYNINDFWETMAASITNPDLVLFGGVELYRSTNGGGNFTRVNGWGEYYGDPANMLHADLPGIDCIMAPWGETWYIATDGGLYLSLDGVDTVQNVSLQNLGVSQYYSVYTSARDPRIVAAGSQDQGYQLAVPSGSPAPTMDFRQIISGDYGHITSGDGTLDLAYSDYPGWILIHDGETNPKIHSANFPDGESYTSWMPFLLADPDDPEVFYFCANHIWRYYRYHQSLWKKQMLPFNFNDNGSGFATALGISPANTNRWWVVTNKGAIWYSRDRGQTWTQSETDGPVDDWLYGSDVLPDPLDPNVVWVCGSGYSNPPVYRSTNGGVTFEPMRQGLPATVVYEMDYETPSGGAVYAASYAGAYRFDPETEVWSNIQGTQAPQTTYWTVQNVPAASVVRFGTYGRGIWDYTPPKATGQVGAALGPGGDSFVQTVYGKNEVEVLRLQADSDHPNAGTFIASGDTDDDGYAEWITGGDMGSLPLVQIFSLGGFRESVFFPYNEGFSGGVRVAAGDVNGDGVDEIITGPGPGGGPHVRIFDGEGNPQGGFMAFASDAREGVFVAAGDLDGDGIDEIIVSRDRGVQTEIRTFYGDGTPTGVSFRPFGVNFLGGARVAAGDLNKDGVAEIIAGAGNGGAPHVRVFHADGRPKGRSFLAYRSTFKGGVYVAAGDIDRDGKVEIITGAGKPGGPHVRGFHADGTPSGLSYIALGSTIKSGVRVAALR